MAAHTRAAASYTLTPVTYGMQLKTPDGRVVFEYLTAKPADSGLTSPSAACFHPVNTPSGERISALAPNDHPHHRGMYMAWHDAEFRQAIDPARATATSPLFGWNITRADFWGWGEYAPRDGRVIENRGVTLVSADATRAEIEIHNDWNVGTGPRPRKMLDETTTATVTERDGVFVIDVSFRIAPLVHYHLNKQSFSGFNLQARKDGESVLHQSGRHGHAPRPALLGARAELAALALVRLRDHARQREDARRRRARSSVESAVDLAQLAQPLDAQSQHRRTGPGRHSSRRAADAALSCRRA